MNNEEIWQAALTDLEVSVSKANFVTWFQNTSIATRQSGTIVLCVPNAFVKEWLEYKYHKTIMKSLRTLCPETRIVEYIISSQLQPLLQKQRRERVFEQREGEEQMEFKELLVDRDTNLNPRYTFENFVVGSFNELAHAASIAVTNNPGRVYNPLFIYGGVGLGKTHLLQSVGNAVKKTNPKSKIQYLSAERFTSELVNSMQNNEAHLFKEKYRSFDLLIIDDIQFIAGKTKTQEEFFHTFNSLYEAGKQIIFSSDKPPQSIQNLEERLRSRFEGGMVADISQPEYESRLAILKNKAISKEPQPSEEIIEFIAANVQKNIRELEGALNAVVARTKLSGRVLSIPEVKDILAKNTQPKKMVTANQIIKAVAEFYGVNEKSLYEKTRKKEVVKPRQIAMYLLREDFNGSYPYIGQRFGGRDHTTAIHSFEKVSQDIKKNSQLYAEIKLIRERLYEYSVE
uniref:Chromosomal replication initiator protein DnaA n=1 Tax=Candidatus Giovannonibacteria bacterium GW2011_GWF2_42_19 TaxID=1618659 RepID=A0A0G0ZGK2_9BACT|nr:MAG: Chromosomal replication initiator protein DnaA [Candidatus Giovannonibacteria bacterium GW2011_GWF2_42_19]